MLDRVKSGKTLGNSAPDQHRAYKILYKVLDKWTQFTCPFTHTHTCKYSDIHTYGVFSTFNCWMALQYLAHKLCRPKTIKWKYTHLGQPSCCHCHWHCWHNIWLALFIISGGLCKLVHLSVSLWLYHMFIRCARLSQTHVGLLQLYHSSAIYDFFYPRTIVPRILADGVTV